MVWNAHKQRSPVNSADRLECQLELLIREKSVSKATMLKLNIPKQLPLLNQSIINVHRLLQNGEITSVDLAKACLQRINDTRVLNAFVSIDDQLSLQQASHSEQRFKNGLLKYYFDCI